MANPSVYVDVVARDKNASRTFDKVGDSADKAGGKMGKVSKLMGTAAKAGALGLAVGAGAAVVALADMTKGAIEDEAAQKKLAKTLTNAAGARSKDVKSVETWISKQGQALGITDDELRPALGRLVTATGDVGKAQRLAALGMDVSAGTGKSLKQVTEALAKAENGQVAGLSRLGIATKDANGETKSFAQIQGELQKKFGGQASTAANTLEGKMGRLKLVMDETKETIGSKLIPVITVMATWFLTKGIPAISKTWSFLKDKLGPVFGAVGGAIKRFAPIVVDVTGRVAAAFGKMSGDSGGKMAQIRDTVRDAFTIIRGIFTTTVTVLKALWSTFGGTITSFARSTFKNLTTIFGGAFDVIRGVFKVFASLFKGDWKGVWDGIKLIVKGALGIIKGTLKQAWAIIKGIAKLGWDAIKATIGRALGAITGLAAKWAKALGNKIWDGIKAIGGKLRTIGTWIWSNFYPGPLLRLSGRVFGAAKSIGGKIWDGIKSVGGRLATIGSWAWDRFRGGLDRLRDRFTSAGSRLLSGLVSGLRNQWSKVKDLTKKPLNLIIDVAVNPFIRAVNKLPGVDIPRVPGFAGGGWTGPGSKYQPAGVVHADEFVINKRSRGAIERRAPGFLDYLNGFASGGRVWPLAGGVASTYAGHSGVDLNAPNDYGKPVHAVTGGTAYGASIAGSYGNHVNLYTASGVRQIYAHLAGFGKLGRVSAGDTIGYVGSTGNSTGPHLHFEVRPGGTYASAMAYLSGASNPKGGGGLLGSIFGKFKDGAAWFKDKIGDLIPKVKGGGLFSTSAMQSLAKHVLTGIKSKVPGFATGGMVKASPGGSLIRVGEGGLDEAIVPIMGGRRRGGSGGAPVVVQVKVEGSVIVERDLIDSITRGIDQARRAQGQRTSILKVS